MGGDAKNGNYSVVGMLPSIAENDTFLKRFRIVEKIGEGSYSEVVKCKNRETGAFVACKRLRHIYKNWNQVNDIAEVTTLRTLARHPQILQMLEIHYDARQGKVSLVFEIMDMNLYEFIKDRKRLLPESTVRLFMYQLLKALRHLHKFGVFHRDIKPENILIRIKSSVLKLGDLGSVRGIYSQPPFTEYISTRWYRSPECLLTAGQYGFKMDIWAAGCVFYEILTLQPLFPGSSEIDQINRIHSITGPPPHKTLQKFSKFAEIDKKLYRSKNQENRWNSILKVINEFCKNPKYDEGKPKNFELTVTGKEIGLDRKLPGFISAGARDLVKQMLIYDPDGRPTSQRAMNHPYFNDVRDFKVPENEIIKAPIIAVCGDERGRSMISHYYGHVDLKTLGDKKPKRIQIQLSTQKQQQVTPTRQSSSLILEGALSPETPKKDEPNVDMKKTSNGIRSRTLKASLPRPSDDNKDKLLEISHHESPPKKVLKTVISGNKNQDKEKLSEKPQKTDNTRLTIKKKTVNPADNAAAKPAVPNRPNLVLTTNTNDKNNNNAAIKRPVPSKYIGATLYRSEKISTNIARETRMALIAQSIENAARQNVTKVDSSSSSYAAKAAKRLGLSFPPTTTDYNNNPYLTLPTKQVGGATIEKSIPPPIDWNHNVATTTKPPLPPKYVGTTVSRLDLAEKDPVTNISKETRIAQILENAATRQNTRRIENSSLEPKTFGIFNEPEALKRRTERIRAQLRDDVYCSSDDDIVATMRQKLDILISERARRASNSSHNEFIPEEDNRAFETKSKNLRPRKLLRRDTLSTADMEVGKSNMHSLSVGDTKKGRQSFANCKL